MDQVVEAENGHSKASSIDVLEIVEDPSHWETAVWGIIEATLLDLQTIAYSPGPVPVLTPKGAITVFCRRRSMVAFLHREAEGSRCSIGPKKSHPRS
jgi:hypothetical protein